MKPYEKHLFLFLTVVAMQCRGIVDPILPYTPPVTFTGYFNGDYDSLAGNRTWRNTCEMVGDTVRIYCYSTYFDESDNIRHGNLLRLDFYPDSAEAFQKRNTLFHLARYFEQNESYTINPGDTLDITRQLESDIAEIPHANGAPLELENVYITSPPLGHGRLLQITNGHLFGNIRTP